jgi:FkbM family methyltransferase
MLRLKRRSLVVDVGANRGYYTAFLSAIGMKVIAYEPLGFLYKWKNVEKRTAVVGNVNGKIVFNVGNDSSHSSVTDIVPCGVSHCMTVKSVRLDDETFPERVAFLKIDAQGLDHEVLLGAEKLLKKDKPVVLVECFPDGLAERGYTQKSMTDFMARLGYRFKITNQHSNGMDLLFQQ